jgi:hypothetical protein
MEVTRQEIAAVEEATRETEAQVCELSELQLALVGGGIGSVVVG